ncbi:Waprin-Enh1 [Varanus komodoensis]|nr:Waprin-Enh1 [Varanus komodoensis]
MTSTTTWLLVGVLALWAQLPSVSTIPPRDKIGTCPPSPYRCAYPGEDLCSIDYDCEGIKKCCFWDCRKVCRNPQELQAFVPGLQRHWFASCLPPKPCAHPALRSEEKEQSEVQCAQTMQERPCVASSWETLNAARTSAKKYTLANLPINLAPALPCRITAQSKDERFAAMTMTAQKSKNAVIYLAGKLVWTHDTVRANLNLLTDFSLGFPSEIIESVGTVTTDASSSDFSIPYVIHNLHSRPSSGVVHNAEELPASPD